MESVTLAVEVILLVRGTLVLTDLRTPMTSADIRASVVIILYDQSKTIAGLLVTLMAACTTAAAVAMNFASAPLRYDKHCLVTSRTDSLLGVWCAVPTDVLSV